VSVNRGYNVDRPRIAGRNTVIKIGCFLDSLKELSVNRGSNVDRGTENNYKKTVRLKSAVSATTELDKPLW
jgi:hypothetical protein